MIRAAAVAAALAGCGGSAAAPRVPASASCAGGPVVVSSQAEVEALAACPIVGGMTIRTGADLDLTHLGQLRRVERTAAAPGDLVIGPSVGLAAVELPNLQEVEGVLRVVGNGSLTILSLPRLTRVGRLEIEGNVELRVLRVPALISVAGDLRVSRAASLTMIDATALATIDGRLSIDDAPALSVIEISALTRVGGVDVAHTDLDVEQIHGLEALAR